MTGKKRGRKPMDFTGADWSLPSKALAQQFDCSVRTIDMWRERLGKPLPKRNIDWQNLDWSQSDRAIAHQIGLSPARVHQVRHKLGIKPYKKTCRSNALVNYNRSRSADWDSVDWTMSDKQIANLLGRSLASVCRKRHALGKVGERPQRTW